MYYNSSKHGRIEIAKMATPHVKNALGKLQKKSILLRTSEEYEVIGALKQALAERERNPSTSALKEEFENLKDELENVKEFQNKLRSVVNQF